MNKIVVLVLGIVLIAAAFLIFGGKSILKPLFKDKKPPVLIEKITQEPLPSSKPDEVSNLEKELSDLEVDLDGMNQIVADDSLNLDKDLMEVER